MFSNFDTVLCSNDIILVFLPILMYFSCHRRLKSIHILKIVFIFREKGQEGEREREKH